MEGLKCSIVVQAGLVPGEPLEGSARRWDFTQQDLDNPPKFIDGSGAAMNYAMHLQNPNKFNWVKLEWIWY